MALVDTFVVDDGTVVSAAPPPTYPNQVLLDGAAFYWRLGEAAGTTAVDQKGILNGTHLGAVSVAQPGALGGSGDTDLSVSYAATGRTEVVADPRHQSFSNWTLELWAYPTGGGYLAIAGHGYVGAGYMPYVIGLDQTTGYIPTAGFFNGSSWQRVQDSVQVTLNTWVHLVGTFDGTTIRLYRNGVLVASGPGTGWTAAPAAAPFRIGERWDEGQFFPGRVDEVALYPTALSAAQILAHYTAGTTSPGPPQTVVVPSVWPVGSQVSIVGQVVSGDGHRVGGTLGSQFGTPTFTVKFPGVQVGGVASAQSFGVPVIKATRTLTLTGIASAQSFGAITVKTTVTQPSGGVPSAQQFGTVAILLLQTRIVSGVPSAQAFGVVRAIFPPQTVLVPGLIHPLPPTVDSITGEVICGDGHVVGGMNVIFGRVHILFSQPISLAGVPSAQQFGAITLHTTVTIHVGGVASAQSFGTVTIHRYDLHLDCKPDGSLGIGCKPDGSFVITSRTDGSFAINPSSTGTLTLTPKTDGNFVLVPTDEDG